MDELIILLIKALIEGFGSGPRKKQEQARAQALSWQGLVQSQQQFVPPPPVLPGGPPAVVPKPPPTQAALDAIALAETPRITGQPARSSITPRELGDRSTLRRRFILSEILRPPLALRRPTPGNHHA